MALRKRIVLAVIWAASLVAVGAWVQAETLQNPSTNPVIVSGSDLGFRIEGRRGNTPIGTLVVRINGQWVPAESAAGPKALTAR
jgi:hypothetical protein